MVKYDKNLNKMVEDLTDFKSFKTFAMEAVKLTGEIQDLVDGKNLGFIMIVMSTTLAEIICDQSSSKDMAKAGAALANKVIHDYIELTMDDEATTEGSKTIQ